MKILRTSKKSEKNKVVLFSSNYAKILINPKGLRFYKNRANALVNPYIGNIMHIPMQYWKKEGNRITVMNELERTARDLDMEYNGIDHNFGLGEVLRHKTTVLEMVAMISVSMNILTVLYLLSRLVHD